MTILRLASGPGYRSVMPACVAAFACASVRSHRP